MMSGYGCECVDIVCVVCEGFYKIGMILGFGFGVLVEEVEDVVCIFYFCLIEFLVFIVMFYLSELVVGIFVGVLVVIFFGWVYYYESGDLMVMCIFVEMLKEFGCEVFLVINVVGLLCEDVVLGSLMLIFDYINWLGKNLLIGEEDEKCFFDMSMVYDLDFRVVMKKVVMEIGDLVVEGVYMWFLGLFFEILVEIRMVKIFGVDVVGMLIVLEVIMVCFVGLCVVVMLIIINYGVGMQIYVLFYDEIKFVVLQGMEWMKQLVWVFVKEVG